MDKPRPPRPEPRWWAEARRLRAEGWKIEAIMAQLNRCRSSVRCALNPDLHVRQLKSQRRWWRKQDATYLAARNKRRRLAYARRQKKKWEEREKVLDTSDRHGKMAHDTDHHGPLNTSGDH